jgi:hypothetical protein
MLTAFIFLLAACLVGQIVKDSSHDRRARRWAQVDQDRDLMFRKYFELTNDPSMTPNRWREWLPIFEEVDRNYAENDYYNVNPFSLAQKVREEIEIYKDFTGV